MLMRKCLLVMLILMLFLMLLNLNTSYADTDADLRIRIMSLCCTGFQDNNAKYIISSHYVQRGKMKLDTLISCTEGEMKLDTYVGKRVSLSSCFFFGLRSYTDIRNKQG